MDELPTLSHRQHQAINKDHRKAASTVHLSYVTSTTKGIRREKKGKSYIYLSGDKKIKDEKDLKRIKALAIPPSWSDVWICADPSGHIQATGTDLNGRKQYRYHSNWNLLRNETKFHRMLEFGKSLPTLRKKLRRDLAAKELSADKVVAASIRLMEQTSIRVGNNGYEKKYGSYGLTTLKDRHVKFEADKAKFSFIGKKGIEQNVTLKNKKLARIIKQCRDIPGKELFQYYDEQGNHKSIDSGMVNNYIKEASQGDFSAKDFRTWAGTLQALECFCAAGKAEKDKEIKKNVVAVLDEVSAKLGNTRSVCKKYYVHPRLIECYEQNKLPVIPTRDGSISGGDGLTSNEKVLMKLLKRFG